MTIARLMAMCYGGAQRADDVRTASAINMP